EQDFLKRLLARLSFAFIVYFTNCLIRLSTCTCGFVAFLAGVLIHHWYWLHGVKLTRKEMIFFDETNLLETSNVFEYTSVPITEGTTPISVLQRTLWPCMGNCKKERTRMESNTFSENSER
ncbi:hypothetical protein COOONC_24326, partial [Cooperia oncophora]